MSVRLINICIDYKLMEYILNSGVFYFYMVFIGKPTTEVTIETAQMFLQSYELQISVKHQITE